MCHLEIISARYINIGTVSPKRTPPSAPTFYLAGIFDDNAPIGITSSTRDDTDRVSPVRKHLRAHTILNSIGSHLHRSHVLEYIYCADEKDYLATYSFPWGILP